MNVDRAVMAMAGSFILISVVLGIVWTQWALLFTVFVGANLLQAAFTGFCPAAMLFSKLGLRSGCAFGGPDET
ncbi:MAG: DUF2892 domain-containing protein [Puniceicoccaceae bacterium]